MEQRPREHPVGGVRHGVEPAGPDRVLPRAGGQRGEVRVLRGAVALEVVGEVLEQRLDGVGEPGDLVDLPVGDHEQVGHVAGAEHRVELVGVGRAVLQARVQIHAQLGVDRRQVGVAAQRRRGGPPPRAHAADRRAAPAGLLGDGVDQAAGVAEVAVGDRPFPDDVGLEQLGRLVGGQHRPDGVALRGAALAPGLLAATGQGGAAHRRGGAEAEQAQQGPSVGGYARQGRLHGALPSSSDNGFADRSCPARISWGSSQTN